MTAIPAELRERRQWVAWRYEERGGRRTKVPLRPDGSARRASSTDAASWGSYDAAVKAAESADGIGFVFTADDGLAGIDLDDCFVDGELHDDAAAIVERLASFTELSPSRTGVHVIVRATLNGGRSRTAATPWGSEFENYDRARFFCMTGEPLPGTPAEINDRQAELDAIRAELLPEPKATAKRAPQPSPLADDAELLDRARKARNGADFDALWRGDTGAYGDDASAADLALAGSLAFWCGPDPARIDALFRRSGCMRPKWDERRGDSTYGAQTVEKALSGRSEFYGDARNGHTANGAGRAGTARGTDAYVVVFDTSGKVPKLILPAVPDDDDAAGQSAWLTAVFNLNPAHPVTGGVWQGVAGPDGQIVLRRAGARDIRFEPARVLNTPMRLIDCFVGRKHPGDGMLHAYKAEHCRLIRHVVECLCDTSQALTEAQEAVGIIGAFLQVADAVEGCTVYGTAAQRYEAARALRRDAIRPHYLIDANTGELVIGVSDLADRARSHVGSSLPRGWLDARMANIDWTRACLDGHAEPGRAGRVSPHATVNVYRGHLPAVTK